MAIPVYGFEGGIAGAGVHTPFSSKGNGKRSPRRGGGASLTRRSRIREAVILAFIEQPEVIEKILALLGLFPALSLSKGPAPAHSPPAHSVAA